MLHRLEETSVDDWFLMEVGKCYIEVVKRLFKRLEIALRAGYLPCYFVYEMNLLDGYSAAFLKEMVEKVRELHQVWGSVAGYEIFHTSIKSMYSHITSNRLFYPNAKKAQAVTECFNFDSLLTSVMKMGPNWGKNDSTYEKIMSLDPQRDYQEILETLFNALMPSEFFEMIINMIEANDGDCTGLSTRAEHVQN